MALCPHPQDPNRKAELKRAKADPVGYHGEYWASNREEEEAVRAHGKLAPAVEKGSPEYEGARIAWDAHLNAAIEAARRANAGRAPSQSMAPADVEQRVFRSMMAHYGIAHRAGTGNKLMATVRMLLRDAGGDETKIGAEQFDAARALLPSDAFA